MIYNWLVDHFMTDHKAITVYEPWLINADNSCLIRKRNLSLIYSNSSWKQTEVSGYDLNQTGSFWSYERVNKCQASTVTTLTTHRRAAHQAPFVNGVTDSSWWWHSRALDAALCPLGGWTPDRAVQPSPQRRDSSGQRGQVSSRKSWGKVGEQKPQSSPDQWDD